jgi:hypothetical protein
LSSSLLVNALSNLAAKVASNLRIVLPISVEALVTSTPVVSELNITGLPL